MFLMFPSALERKYLRGMSVRHPWIFRLNAAEVANEERHAASQHPEENAAEHRARAIARCASRKRSAHFSLAHPPAWLLWVVVLIVVFLLGRASHAQAAVNAYRVGGTDVPSGLVSANGFKVDISNSSLHFICDSGCIGASGTQDVNFKNYNGAAVSATNAAWVQPGTGAVFTVTWPSALPVSSTQLPASLDGSGFFKVSIQNATIAVTQSAGPWQVQSNSANLATETTHASIKTNTDPLVAAGGGGYVRQDSTATIAKETGGNLATIATNSATQATAAKQDTGNTSLASIDAKTPALVNGGQPVTIISAPSALTPPVLTQQQLNNQLLYQSAMKDYCRVNLCPAIPKGIK